MRIVVTGAGKNGFLGWHVKKAFKPYKARGPQDTDKHYIFYSGREYDLVSHSSTRAMFLDLKPDVVVHMAAVCGGILANKNFPADFLWKNTQMGINIYNAAKEYGCKRIYTLGSVCAYPKHCPVPFKEDDLFNGYPEETNAPYGQSKRTLFMLGNAYRNQHGIGGTHLIPVNMYGEKDHFDLTNSHVIPALINKFTNAVEKELETVYVWGTGEATREFLYAGDCAEAIVKAVMSELDTPLPINIGTGADISIRDLAFKLGDLIGFKGKIEFTGEVSDGQLKRRLSVERAKELLEFGASTSLDDGLKKTIEWYNDNRKD